MASTPVPRFVVFARKLTLVSGLALPLAGCADKAGSKDDAAVMVDSSDAAIELAGVKPFPQDAADDADVQSPPEVAAEVAPEVATDVAAEVEPCRVVMGVSTLPDASGDATITFPGVKPLPPDGGNGGCDGGIVPVGGPLAPPEFLA